MTKSVTIVNTSNHSGECIELSSASQEAIVLAPGEEFVIGEHEYESLKISGAQAGEVKPIKIGEKQVFPFVAVGFK